MFSLLGIYFKKPPAVGIGEIQAVMKREKKSATTIRLILLVLLLTFLPALLWPIVLGLKGIDNVGPYRPFISFLFILSHYPYLPTLVATFFSSVTVIFSICL